VENYNTDLPDSLARFIGGEWRATAFLFQRLETVASSYERLFERDVKDQDLSRVLQVTFKKQVQEWKELLLRGKEPANFKRYNDAFHQQEDAVREILARLKRSIEDEKAAQLLDRFAQAHQTMMTKYEAALVVFSGSKENAQAAADQTAEQVAGASMQISSRPQILARGASEQAASLEETSASSDKSASITRRNAENSKESAG
jgi:methyl-accepting chemotaxis protein